ncbi:hypothetical protein [Spirillospora sp. CA-294931]|uniref:hypothetical protein n=1 Tax=Spirillospora sp. CA-294931 TaxID=3240042 RepID=UPI003D8D4684
MNEHIAYVTKQIEASDTVQALLTAAFIGLELIERATTLLADIAPETRYPAYAAALAESTQAWWALAEAPALSWPEAAQLVADTGHREFADSINKLVLVTGEALLNAANKVSEPADRIACLKAARHAGRVHTALQ